MKKISKINEISSLINIRNYIYLQIENPKTEKKTSLKLINILNEIDIELNNEILKIFLKNENTKQANI